MRSRMLALLGCTALAGCGATPVPQPSESARLDEWFALRWEEQLDFSPIEKTMLGRRDDYDEIDDASEAAEQAQLEWRRATAAALEREFDYDRLTPEAKTSYDLWLYELERAEAARPFRRHHYVFTQLDGPHTFLPNFLINFHEVENADDMRAYVARIAGVAHAIGQFVERARRSAEKGVRPPRFAFETAIAQTRALLSGAPFEGEGEAPLWADAKGEIEALLERGEIAESGALALRDAVRAALRDHFAPAYGRLLRWLEEEMQRSAELAKGVWALPDGRAYYAERLAFSTTTTLSADAVHALGLAEVARIRTEMEAQKRQLGFDGTLEDFFTFVREDPRFYYSNSQAGREAYLEAARRYLEAIREKLPGYFGLLPKADLVVRRVEAFRERDGAAQHYYAGSPDGSRPGIFYAHLSDMGSMPIPQLEVIAYHEGNPGHHLQLSIAQERASLPRFRTRAFFTAFIEGWALYAERLAKEMGAFQDPYSDFGRLTTEIWRAIRLVLDTGLHARGWSEEEAVAYFMANSAAAESQIRSEVRRYLTSPGQATAYKVGMLEILKLRAEARAKLTDAFDIRDFHDTVLGGGALPLPLLEQRLDAWLAQEQRAR